MLFDILVINIKYIKKKESQLGEKTVKKVILISFFMVICFYNNTLAQEDWQTIYKKAQSLYMQKNLTEAAIYSKQAVTVADSVYGSESKQTALSWNLAGLALLDTHDFDAAIFHFNHVLEINDKISCLDLKEKCQLYDNIALANDSNGDRYSALDNFRKSLQLKLNAKDRDELSIADSYFQLGNMYLTANIADSAYYYFDSTRIMREIVYGKDSDALISVLDLQIQIANQFQNVVVELEHLYQRLDIANKYEGPNSSKSLALLNKIAAAHEVMREWDLALEAYQKMTDIIDFNKYESCNICGKIFNSYGEALRVKKKYDSSLVFYNRALDEFSKLYPTPNNYFSEVYSNMGAAYISLNKLDDAEKQFLKALDIFNKTGMSSGRSLVYTLNNLAAVYFNKKEYKKSISCYEKSLNAVRPDSEGAQKDTYNLYKNIAFVYEKSGNKKKAEEYKKKADDMLK